MGGLTKWLDDKTDRMILSKYPGTSIPFFLDPHETITKEFIEEACQKLSISKQEILKRYEKIAGQFDLKPFKIELH